MSRLTRVGRLLLALMAVVAFSAVATAAAQAVDGPHWTVEGKRLGSGEKEEVAAKAAESSVLTAGTRKVTCKGLEAKAGSAILGSAEGEAGKNEEVLRYTECSVTGNGTKCAVTNNEVVTNALKSELVEDAATKKKLLVDFLPASGKVFATLKFTPEAGGTCEATESKVTGIDVLAEALTDPGKEPIELEGTARGEAKSWYLEVENPQPSAFWLVKEGAGKEVKIGTEEKLEAFGVPATLTGLALVTLVSGKNWSPLA